MNMKKNNILMLVMTLIMALGMSQGVMAKEKKVKYLGHNYKGEVDDNKVPSGKGIMNVNGLMIEGTFNNCTVTDAEVWRTAVLGTINTTFKGIITYDESENIVLKAGGEITTKYYYGDYGSSNSISCDPSVMTDLLKENRIVNSNNFEPNELEIQIPMAILPLTPLEHELKIPSFKTSCTVGLTHITQYRGKNVNMNVFVVDRQKSSSGIVENYKDDIGRIWNYKLESMSYPYSGESIETISILYPNGSKFSCTSDKKMCKSVSWELHYKDGKVVKTNWLSTGFGRIFYIGDFSISYQAGVNCWSITKVFLDNLEKDKFIAPYEYDISLHSNSLDFSKLSNKEIEKYISEEVIPFIESGDKCVYTTDWGKYKNGVFTSNKEVEAAKKARAAAAAKEMRSYIAQFKKKYGFDPSAISYKNVIVPGRSWNALAAWNEWCNSYGNFMETIYVTLLRDSGSSKYYSFGMGAYKGNFWITNGKITSVRWY